jgi:enoyl-CoA hydratase
MTASGVTPAPATLTVEGAVATIVIDNPPVNALHPSVSHAIHRCLQEAGANADVRCVILTGTGKHFVAGADLHYVTTIDRTEGERYALSVQAMQDTIGTIPQPVIAAINGTALGGGCELAMACDIRIADERAIFGQPETTLGLIPGAGGTQNLPRLVGVGRAKRMVYTGERIKAPEALAIGLVDEVVPAGTVLDAARTLAETIAANAPLAVTAAKRAITLGMQMSVLDAHRMEATLFAPLVETQDLQEGARAFFEKRPPVFRRH